MSAPTRRALTIDDPVAGREACHVARPAPGEATPGQLQHLPLDQIRPNPSQPRKQFDGPALAGLADSIRDRGVLQPIIVRPVKDGGFEIVAGERRWRAAPEAGLSTIPALVDGSLDGADSLEIALIENVVRDSAIATLVERQTRYCHLGALPEGTNAEPVCEALHASITTLAAQLRRSLTWDQGKEMAEHRQFSARPASRCTSAIHQARGSASRTRTPTVSCASTSLRARVSPA